MKESWHAREGANNLPFLINQSINHKVLSISIDHNQSKSTHLHGCGYLSERRPPPRLILEQFANAARNFRPCRSSGVHRVMSVTRSVSQSLASVIEDQESLEGSRLFELRLHTVHGTPCLQSAVKPQASPLVSAALHSRLL